MDEKEFKKHVKEFFNAINRLSETEKKEFKNLAKKELEEISNLNLEEICGIKNKNKNEINKVLDKLKNDLDFLRLHIKYLLFDLEATRRENAYLRKMLEDIS